MFIIVAIIYSSYTVLANESGRCECNVLQIRDSYGLIGIQNFTKQNGTYLGNPYYFSTKQNMISSYNEYWYYRQYNATEKKFELRQKYSKEDFFSIENKCKNETKKSGKYISAISRCLRDNSDCSGTIELFYNFKGVKLQAKNPCKFPFIYKNVKYKSCTNITHNKYWCATTVNATNHLTSWGYCSDSCPLEVDEAAVNVKLVVGILVGILLMVAFVIGYRCMMKKKVVALENAKVTDEVGGFQLLDLIIPELKSHVIPYKFKSSHWLKLQHSDWRANLVKDFFLQMNFPPMRALEFIRDHMTFKLRYNQI